MSQFSLASSAITNTFMQSQRFNTNAVEIAIPAALHRPTHTLYNIQITVHPTQQIWTVNRRYSQFHTLRKELLQLSINGQKLYKCTTCQVFYQYLAMFHFPWKTPFRTKANVRKRVVAFQLLLNGIAKRVYNDLAKCRICDQEFKRLLRPFLQRGAKPLEGSTMSRIQQSLRLSSYSTRVYQGPRIQENRNPIHKDELETSISSSQESTVRSGASNNHSNSYSIDHSSGKKKFKANQAYNVTMLHKKYSPTSSSTTSFTSSQLEQHYNTGYYHDSNNNSMSFAILQNPNDEMESSIAILQNSIVSNSSRVYDKKFGFHSGIEYEITRCHDPRVPVKEAAQQLVLHPERKDRTNNWNKQALSPSMEEVAYRLSSMWHGYEERETLKELRKEKLDIKELQNEEIDVDSEREQLQNEMNSIDNSRISFTI